MSCGFGIMVSVAHGRDMDGQGTCQEGCMEESTCPRHIGCQRLIECRNTRLMGRSS